MNLGTKSLLFGNHQFILHPLFVTWGWRKYHKKWPTWTEFICIVIHDWGYWGCKEMDGEDRVWHVMRAVTLARKYLDIFPNAMYQILCQYHSGTAAKYHNKPVSPLCWPDKLGSVLQPWWLWVGLGLLSGEIYEYTSNPEFMNFLGHPGDYKEYFMAYRKHVLKQVVFKHGR